MARVLRLSDCEAGFVASPNPVWVVDLETIEFLWVNEAGLELWGARDRAELFARDLLAGAPQKVLGRLHHALARVRAGERLREEWAFYPRGEPIMVLLDLCAVEMPDGRRGMLNQVMPLGSGASHSTQRALSAARHLSVIFALVDGRGAVLSCNPAAVRAFGEVERWPACFIDPEQGETIIRDALAGETVKALVEVSSRGARRWHAIEAERLRDPVSGDQGVLIEHRDETARIEAESLAEARGREVDELDAALKLVQRQRSEILELSAPMLEVGRQTLAVPIVGRFDEDHSVALSTKLLDAVAGRRIRRVILDLTGVATIDADNTARLRALVRSLRLLGADAVLTGIQPAVARELGAASGLGDTSTLRSLAVALAQYGSGSRRR